MSLNGELDSLTTSTPNGAPAFAGVGVQIYRISCTATLPN